MNNNNNLKKWIVTNRDEQGEKGRRKKRPMEGEEKWQGPSGVVSPEGLLEKCSTLGVDEASCPLLWLIRVHIKDYSIIRDKNNEKNEYK